MAEYKLSNPLTIEEKLQVTRLIGHDSMGILDVIRSDILIAQGDNDVSQLKNTLYVVQHIGMLNMAITSLTLHNKYTLDDLRTDNYFDAFKLQNDFDGLNALFKEEMTFLKDISHKEFLSDRSLVHCVLYNLSKNAFKRGGAKKVEISVKEHSTLQDIVYSAEGSLDYKDFIGFHVHDNGRGFPSGKDLREYFTTIPERKSSGFGLYFVGLAAKVLRGQVGIKSEPGDTTVSFYHPIYVDLKQNK